MSHRFAITTVALLFLVSVSSAQDPMRVAPSTVPNRVRYVDDEFIVVFKGAVRKSLRVTADPAGRPKVSISSVQDILEFNGVTVLRRQFPAAHLAAARTPGHDLTGHYKIKLMPGVDLDAAIADFAADPNVDHVEKIGIHPLYLEPNDTYYDSPPAAFPHNAWHIKQVADHDIDANLAWDLETGDATVIVGVMDSGVRYIHRDLGGPNPPGPADNITNGNIWVNSDEIPGNSTDDDGNGFVDDVIGYDFVQTSGPNQCASSLGEDCTGPDNDPADFNGHGTAVAGCIAAITNNASGVVGVAGGFSNGSTSGAGNGCRVMCLRIGWHGQDGNGYVRMDFAAEAIQYAVQKKLDGHNIVALNASWGSSNSGGIDAAIDLALANDIMIIHAAGNDGANSPGYLGSKAGVMNVAATDSNDVRTSFTNFGSWVDLAAPGDDIITTYHNLQDPGGDYVVLIGGTSFSAPLTCGAAALLESLVPALTGPEKFNILVATGDAIASPDVGLRLSVRSALDAAGACVDVAAPSVVVTFPDGGESIAAGTVSTISWNASDDCGITGTEIRLDRTDDGVYEEQIALLSGNPGLFAWTVTGPATANARIQVIATDGAANVTSDGSNQTFAITFNQPPVLAPIGPQSVDEGQNLNVTVSATDPDLDSVILSASGVPFGASFTDNFDGTGVLNFNPGFTQSGSYGVTIIASDGMLSSVEVITVTVNNVNREPVLGVIGAQIVDEGQTLAFGVSASDPDLDGLLLSALDLPLNAGFIDNLDGTGTFDFTPDFSQSGVFDVRFVASDGELADTEVVAITVNNINRAPTLGLSGPQILDEGQVLNLAVSGFDPDADAVTLTAENMPANALFVDNHDGTGQFDFTPDYDQAGSYDVRFIASDGTLADSEIVRITVVDAVPPCICDCHSDPECDGKTDVLDVAKMIDVAFRAGSPIPDPNPFCPLVTTDVTCDGSTTVLDVVRMINVAFRGGDAQVLFCDPCL